MIKRYAVPGFFGSLLVVALTLLISSVSGKNEVPPQTTFSGESVSQHTVPEMMEKLENSSEGWQWKLTAGGHELQLNSRQGIVQIDTEQTMKRLVPRQFTTSVLAWLPGRQPRQIRPVLTVNRDKLVALLEKETKNWNHEPVNASARVLESGVVIRPSEEGMQVNPEVLADAIAESIESGRHALSSQEDSVTGIRILHPSVTTDDLRGVTGVMGKYSVPLKTEDDYDTMRLIVDVMNTICVFPVQNGGNIQDYQFSMQKILSEAGVLLTPVPRTYARFATALYGALASAGMNPEEITCVPDARANDAERGLTLLFDEKRSDLSFVNKSSTPVIVLCAVDNRALTITILGSAEAGHIAEPVQLEVMSRKAVWEVRESTSDLDKGQTKVADAGREGATVRILRGKNGQAQLWKEIVFPAIPKKVLEGKGK